MRQTFVRRSILGLGLGGAVGAVLLGRTRPSYAAPMQFKATLNGASEVPPNTTTGTASVTASFDPATKMLTWNGTYSGLHRRPNSRPLPRPGRARQERRGGGMDFDQRQPFPKPVLGSATLTDGQASDLQAGLLYANIHTAANPGGELRGQVVKA